MTIDLNTERFAFLDSSGFKTTKWSRAISTALALFDRTCNSLSCLPSFVNATPRYLNFFTSFDDTPPTCRENWTGFFEKCSFLVLEVLIFISPVSHVAAKLFNACWRPDSEVEQDHYNYSVKPKIISAIVIQRIAQPENIIARSMYA